MIKQLKLIRPYQWIVLISIASPTLFLIKYFGYGHDSWRTIRVALVDHYSESAAFTTDNIVAPNWLADKLKVGQKQYDKTGRPIAEIIDIDNYEKNNREAKVYLTLKVFTAFQKTPQNYLFQEQPLDIGAPLNLNLDHIVVYSQIIDNNVPPSGYPDQKVVVTLRASKISAALLKKTHPGIKLTNQAKPTDYIGEITAVKVENPQNLNLLEKLSLPADTQDAIITLTLNAHQIDSHWYFIGNQLLKAGNPFDLITNDFNLYSTVIEDVQI